jgi:hypothetical protein
MALIYGRVPYPSDVVIDRYIPNEQNDAWNDLGQRVPLGVCRHSMLGSLIGTDRYFRSGVPSPTHIAPALTDYGVGGATDGDLDGIAYRWNDPRGRRSGWANGGSDGLEGDGVAFVRTLGVNAINRNLVSIERSDGGKIDTPMSPKQFETIARIEAYYVDQAKVPWTDYPFNPNTGIICDYEHWEFATKACPFTVVRAEVVRFQARVREILRQYQGEVAEPAPPIVEKPLPTPEWPNGWTTEQLEKRFGQLIVLDARDNANPTVRVRQNAFNPKGAVSNAWVQVCAELGITELGRMPRPSHHAIDQAPDGTLSETILFPRSGYKDIVFFRGDPKHNAGWIILQR